MLSVPLRAIIKIYYNYIGDASYSCEMNHLVDYGEWSSRFDGEIYASAISDFKAKLAEWKVDFNLFMDELKRYDAKWKGAYDATGLRYMIGELEGHGILSA